MMDHVCIISAFFNKSPKCQQLSESDSGTFTPRGSPKTYLPSKIMLIEVETVVHLQLVLSLKCAVILASFARLS